MSGRVREREVRIVLVAALARNRVIGLRGGLPWRLPGDLAHFRRVTLGKPLILGRKTYAGIGKALPGREMIPVSRRGMEKVDKVCPVTSVEKAIAWGQMRARELGVGEVCVIGGGQIFEALLEVAEGMVLSWIDGEPEGDVWFPDFNSSEWREVSYTRPVLHPGDEFGYVISVLRRRGLCE